MSVFKKSEARGLLSQNLPFFLPERPQVSDRKFSAKGLYLSQEGGNDEGFGKDSFQGAVTVPAGDGAFKHLFRVSSQPLSTVGINTAVWIIVGLRCASVSVVSQWIRLPVGIALGGFADQPHLLSLLFGVLRVASLAAGTVPLWQNRVVRPALRRCFRRLGFWGTAGLGGRKRRPDFFAAVRVDFDSVLRIFLPVCFTVGMAGRKIGLERQTAADRRYFFAGIVVFVHLVLFHLPDPAGHGACDFLTIGCDGTVWCAGRQCLRRDFDLSLLLLFCRFIGRMPDSGLQRLFGQFVSVGRKSSAADGVFPHLTVFGADDFGKPGNAGFAWGRTAGNRILSGASQTMAESLCLSHTGKTTCFRRRTGRFAADPILRRSAATAGETAVPMAEKAPCPAGKALF